MPIPDDGVDHARWPAEARKLALLMVDPKWSGATQEELGKECGYSLRSVQRYMSDPEFKAYVNTVANKAYDDLFPLFVAAMKRGLASGNSKYVELFMKSRGMLKEVRQVTSDVNVNDNRSGVDDLDADIERLRREAGLDSTVN